MASEVPNRLPFRGVAQPGSALGSGPRSRRFKSCRPDYRGGLKRPPRLFPFSGSLSVAWLPGAALRTASKLSVLVVDDDPDILEYLQDFLGAEGFEVTTLADPTLAVERIRDEVFHLVVLDLMMPKLSRASICSRRSARSTTTSR